MQYSLSDFTFDIEFMDGERSRFHADKDAFVTDGSFSFKVVLSCENRVCKVKIPYSSIEDTGKMIRNIAVRFLPMAAKVGDTVICNEKYISRERK